MKKHQNLHQSLTIEKFCHVNPTRKESLRNDKYTNTKINKHSLKYQTNRKNLPVALRSQTFVRNLTAGGVGGYTKQNYNKATTPRY